MAGHVRVEERALLGTGACVIPWIRIGMHAVVGAGAVAIRNVAPGQTVFGNPARPLRPGWPGGGQTARPRIGAFCAPAGPCIADAVTGRAHEDDSGRQSGRVSTMIPVLIPSLPETDAIVPYLRRIDQSHIYSNYGLLSREFTDRLCRFVSEQVGDAPVAATITSSGATAIELTLRCRMAGRKGRLSLS
ncbi:hypothetical protein [Methylobacterium fujisawaense]